MCKEPITTPLHIDKIRDHIEMWLPSSVTKNFLQLHSELITSLRKWHRMRESETEQIVCLHCYIKEVYHWLKAMDSNLGERFIETFSFGFDRESFEKNDIHQVEHVHGKIETEFGICDECGEYTDKLEYMTGEWLCNECVPLV